MSLPTEVEEMLDVLRRKKLDEELREIAQLLEEGLPEKDLKDMQFLERLILSAYHAEGVEGYRKRQWMCEEIAKSKVGIWRPVTQN